MQKILLSLLSFFSGLIIQRHKPYVIGVTGTVGKTTITSHIAHFLVAEYWSKNVWYSSYHYNGEYGLPLTIIGTKSPWKNPFLWIWTFVRAISRVFLPYPRFLVLEYWIDHPGEMDFLLSIVVPDIAIVTRVEPNHLEQFGSLDTYRKDKLKLAIAGKHSIVHETLRQYIDRDVEYFSLGALSDIDASNIEIGITGTTAMVHYNHKDYHLELSAIGAFQIENLLPLYPICNILHIDPKRIPEYAIHSISESGRSNILSGIHASTIIDGSYNWWYLSLREGIISMKSFFHSHRIIFFIGDMRELWDASQAIHEKLANEIISLVPHDVDVSFYLVGPMMQEFVYPILASKFNVFSHLSSQKTGEKIAKDINKNQLPTIIYAKWSQNTIFIEEGIKFFLKNPEDYSKLPRQSPNWIKKKDLFFKSIK